MDEGVDAHLPTPGTTLDLFEPTPDGVVDGRGLRQPGEFGQPTHPGIDFVVQKVGRAGLEPATQGL